jgi:hypothetical protein
MSLICADDWQALRFHLECFEVWDAERTLMKEQDPSEVGEHNTNMSQCSFPLTRISFYARERADLCGAN